MKRCLSSCWWHSGKESACHAGDTRETGSIPGLERSLGGGNPLQYSCWGNPMDRGAWWATVHGAAKSWDMTEHTHTTTALGSFFHFEWCTLLYNLRSVYHSLFFCFPLLWSLVVSSPPLQWSSKKPYVADCHQGAKGDIITLVPNILCVLFILLSSLRKMK